jgi:UDP-N-acetylmuramate--alanine ligase
VDRQVGHSSHAQRIHLVGIGGIGLSAIAQVLAARGHHVSGSDLSGSALMDRLARQGIRVQVGHAAHQIGDADVLIISSAIPESNPEVQAARARGIPVLERQAFLPQLLAGYRCLAVAGTHGKTTTTGMIAHILAQTGHDPSCIVGGILADWGTNALAGSGKDFVIEADEYGRMFHGLTPHVAVITNIEMDHPDCFADLDDMREAFAQFVGRIQPRGRLVACADGEQVRRLLAEQQGALPEVVTYGSNPQNDYVTSDVHANDSGGVDLTVLCGGAVWARASLLLPGAHNALNATAALLVAEASGVAPEQAAEALASFRGVLRRFQVKGQANGVTVVDDYAHHPTEIAATLAAARQRYGARRIWAVLQPHTFSRIEALLSQFAGCMDAADKALVTDVYAARVTERPTVDAARLVEALAHRSARHIGSLQAAEQFLLDKLDSGDVLLTLGAGDGYRIGERVLAALKEREA